MLYLAAPSGCTTERIIRNIKEKLNDVSDIDGFEDLREADQEKIRKAFEDGHGKIGLFLFSDLSPLHRC